MTTQALTNIEVDYRFPAGVDAGQQARVIAVGQTAGTWDRNAAFAHRADAMREHLGEVVHVRALRDGRGQATIRFPRINVEGDIGTLLTMIFGKYSMAGAAKVVDVRLPEDYGTRPASGIAGIRAACAVDERPLVMAIFKPALGLTASDHAKTLLEVAMAGLDVIKDDEILGDLDSAPTLERWSACRAVLEEVRHETGRAPLYAVNVTGRADQVLSRARALVDAGANALLFNVLSHGFSLLETLARDPDIRVPIFAHPALAGALCGAPDHGFDYAVVLGTLLSRAGADAVLYPAHYGSLPFDAQQESRIRHALRHRSVFPVPSAGIHPGIVPRVIGDYGNDVILNAGSGIMDHAGGPAAGVAAFFEALSRSSS